MSAMQMYALCDSDYPFIRKRNYAKGPNEVNDLWYRFMIYDLWSACVFFLLWFSFIFCMTHTAVVECEMVIVVDCIAYTYSCSHQKYCEYPWADALIHIDVKNV